MSRTFSGCTFCEGSHALKSNGFVNLTDGTATSSSSGSRAGPALLLETGAAFELPLVCNVFVCEQQHVQQRFIHARVRARLTPDRAALCTMCEQVTQDYLPSDPAADDVRSLSRLPSPLRFVCCRRRGQGSSGGRVFLDKD